MHAHFVVISVHAIVQSTFQSRVQSTVQVFYCPLVLSRNIAVALVVLSTLSLPKQPIIQNQRDE